MCFRWKGGRRLTDLRQTSRLLGLSKLSLVRREMFPILKSRVASRLGGEWYEVKSIAPLGW